MATKAPVVDLTPSKLDLKLYAGDGAALQFTITDGAVPPAPLPVTGEIIAQIREARPDAEAKVNFTTDMTDPDNGVVTISLSGDDTRLLNTEGEGVQISTFDGVWDVQWTADGGSPVTIMQGNVECVLDVTR